MSDENPYLAIVLDDNKQRIKQSLLTAVDKQPDVEARLQALADQYGIPVDALRLDKGTAERRSKLDAVDYEKIVKDYPFTGSLLSDPQKAAIAHDDIDNSSMPSYHIDYLNVFIVFFILCMVVFCIRHIYLNIVISRWWIAGSVVWIASVFAYFLIFDKITHLHEEHRIYLAIAPPVVAAIAILAWKLAIKKQEH